MAARFDFAARPSNGDALRVLAKPRLGARESATRTTRRIAFKGDRYV